MNAQKFISKEFLQNVDMPFCLFLNSGLNGSSEIYDDMLKDMSFNNENKSSA